MGFILDQVFLELAAAQRARHEYAASLGQHSREAEVEREHRKVCGCLERDRFGQAQPCPALERALEDLR